MSAPLNTCGCCEGVASLTPQALQNRPGLPAIAYRIGTQATFKESMLAAITRSQGLRGLTTREDDDFSIALVDAWATVLDVLTFYQERIANEGYLRTAVERGSVLQLVRTIGYELSPGVAASTFLTFELEAPRGGAPGAARIETGARAQSLPGPGEKPQSFETIEPIDARYEWNALQPRLTQAQSVGLGTKSIYLDGVATNLKPGDTLLFVGSGWPSNKSGERWDFRPIVTVEIDRNANRTKVSWSDGLAFTKGTNQAIPSAQNLEVYTFRQRAGVFGHNAPDWKAMPDSLQGHYSDKAVSEWPNFHLRTPGTSNTIDLDSTYPQVVQGGYLVLTSPSNTELFQASTVTEASRTDFTLTSKTTRVKLAGVLANLDDAHFPLRDTGVFAVSELLTLSEEPIADPIQGDRVDLAELLDVPEKGRFVIVNGRRMRVRANQNLTMVSADGTESRGISRLDRLVVAEAPATDSTGKTRWHLLDQWGFEGFVTPGSGAALTLIPSDPDDPPVSEAVQLLDPLALGQSFTTLVFATSLANIYDRASVTILANVAKATHGETKNEILGSGDASRAFQEFTLKQSPLTYVSAPTSTGAASTLALRVNSILWNETPTFYGDGPRDRDYILRIADDGTVAVRFGDGQTGERPPTGVENVTAVYRVGIGMAGMVKAGQISLLMTRPLGVKGVNNPMAPTGAADPENRDDGRRNAPLKVLTLDRVVSQQDFEDFARAFAGIGKARGDILLDGESRLVLITVAGSRGTVIPETSSTFDNLKSALEAARDPVQRFRIVSFKSLTFDLQLRILIDPAYIKAAVKAAVTAALLDRFSFENRDFAQPVNQSEVLALVQEVPGVTAADLDTLYLTGSAPAPNPRLVGKAGRKESGVILPAQLLTVNPKGLTLLEMTL